MTPPPVRRIAADRRATIAPQPLPTNGSHAQAPPAGPVTRGSSRPERQRVPAIERMRTEQLVLAYGGKPAVKGVSLPVRQGEVLALIGPSGCGKTTLLRSLNRLTELTPTATRDGKIFLDGQDIDELEVTQLRRRISMVFQQPNPFPMSVFDNVAYALREQGKKRPGKRELMPHVEEALRRAGLWDEVSADLSHPALRLSGGQQQRLCIARALAARPEVLLLDEPCSALDPKSTEIIEDLIVRLREEVAVVIVTHNLQQAYRVADHVAFMYLGDLVEYGPTEQVFHAPTQHRTREYVGGAFG
ncbi:phosphate ABC transporter ATP-binding protein [Svornostia abyssi]|uniref:Phosphate ABC transporter ATP-binding protein n=2 Tax=Svornostia abyssi TaxID=2898438 RepID=A0ABY5PQ04_9ACTN|nr:phosphate ABC transporter ATP-binding protein [Parviterribacteraceae bacterium J379]